MRPRLLWINQFAVLPSDGGGTRHFEIGRELVRRGWDVTVAASDFHTHSRTYGRRGRANDRREIVERVDDVEFHWLWSAPYERNDWHRFHNWWTFGWQTLRAARRLPRPSVVIGSSPQPLAALAGLAASRLFRVPFVLEVRDLWPESLHAVSGRKGPGYHVIGFLMRRLYHAATRIVVLAKGSADHLQRELDIPSAKFVYVPNGIDPSMFHPRSEQPRTGFTVVYAGAHGPANGLDVVLDAAELLRDRGDINFLLVGDGPSKSALVADAQRRGLSRVEFRSPIAKREMPDLLDRCDAGLMVLRETPLFSYGVSPNKLFDYLGAGLPVVCNVPGDVANMVAAADAGVQCADGTPRGLADAITTMAALPAERRGAMGISGRQWVGHEHAREIVADRLDAALRPLVATT